MPKLDPEIHRFHIDHRDRDRGFKRLPSPVPADERCRCQAFKDEFEAGRYQQVDFIFEGRGQRPRKLTGYSLVAGEQDPSARIIQEECQHCGRSLGDGRVICSHFSQGSRAVQA